MKNNILKLGAIISLMVLSNCETDSYLKNDSGGLYNSLNSYGSEGDGGEYTGENYQESQHKSYFFKITTTIFYI